MTLLVLIVHLTALFLFVTIEAPEKIMDLVCNNLSLNWRDMDLVDGPLG